MTALPDNALLLSALDCEGSATCVTWSRWTEAGPARWFVPSYLACGNYNDTGLVERSNLRVFRDRFADGQGVWWLDVTGGHGTEAVVIRTLAYRVMRDVREFFDALSQYPLADESDHSDLEQETQAEDWDSYGRDDFRRAMAAGEDEGVSDAVDELLDAQVDALYHHLSRVTGTYPQSEGSGGASLFAADEHAVPRLVNGEVSYAAGDIVAWRDVLATTQDEPQVRCTVHTDCAACPALATACKSA